VNWIRKLFGPAEAATPPPPSAAEPKLESPNVGSLTDRFGHLARPAIHLIRGEPGGFSRLGGLPEMPAHLEWPVWKGKPLSFLAQLDLAEMSAVLPAFLPTSGYLFFFYDQDQDVWGFDPEDFGGWRVLHATGDRTAWVKRSPPPGLGGRWDLPPDSGFSAPD